MSKYRGALPQIGGGLYLTDGGIETTLIFLEGLALPDFASFQILKTVEGEATLRKYFFTYAEIAKKYSTGLILESATWRASTDWGKRLGYSAEELSRVNHQAICLLEEVQQEYDNERCPVVISGCIGPRGDGYIPNNAMTVKQAEKYHQEQVEIFTDSALDMISALTMNYVEEALGVVRAAHRVKMPVTISFTVETDGKLPTGQTLKSAIEQIDNETSSYPCYYMINCAHPTHFQHVLEEGGSWQERIHGIRANASCKSHEELNEAPELDIGNPIELAMQYTEIKKRLKNVNVMGGCCGTDHRHIEQIAKVCAPHFKLSV